MGDAIQEEEPMKCSLKSCPGEYQPQKIAYLLEHEGEIVVFRDVPALVCDVCGDTLLDSEVVEKLSRLLKEKKEPVGTAPVVCYS